jgi:hypothetical protein
MFSNTHLEDTILVAAGQLLLGGFIRIARSSLLFSLTLSQCTLTMFTH